MYYNIPGIISVAQNNGGTVGLIEFSNTTPNFYKFKIIPYENFYIKKILINGISIEINDTFTFNNIINKQYFYVEFEQMITEYIITASTDGNGIISNEGITSIIYGQSKYYQIVPHRGYDIKEIIIDDVIITPSKGYNFSNVKSNHTIHVNFQYNGTIFDISGKIVDINNVGINTCKIIIGDIEGETNNEGNFNLKSVNKGKQLVSIMKSGYKSVTEYININENKSNLLFNLQKETQTYKVSGKINDQYGYLLPYVTISIGEHTTESEGEGIYEISGIPAGTYDMNICKAGYFAKNQKITISNSLSHINHIIFQKYNN